METLCLSDSTAHPDNRLKSLSWPSVQSSNDADYLGSQGYGVRAIGGVWGCAITPCKAIGVAGILTRLFNHFGGVGV
jgi:hypothetical protein